MRTAKFGPRLLVMVKEPLAGRVKTRLAHDIGAVAAAAFYRHTTAALVGRLCSDRRWRTVLAVTPDRAVATAALPVDTARVPQGQGNLGRRMQRLMDALPPGPVVIIGSDCPGIRPKHVAKAFRALRGNDAVLGPSPDGGYWLIGLKRSPRVARPFAGVRWSTPHARSDTLGNLTGLKVAELDTLDDVDDRRDFLRSGHHYGRRVPPVRCML